jgi:hypothetical protein
MKANKITKVLMTASLLALTASVQAADEDFAINFTTIADVSITQLTPMDFGGELNLAPGSSCTMLVSNTVTPSAVVAKAKDGAGAAESATYQDLSGACDAGEKGTAGIYTITGAPGVKVNVTVNALVGGTNFSFVPTATGVVYDNATDGDAFATFTASGNNQTGSVTLASSDDVLGGTGGVPVIGESQLFVGGTITSSATLLAGKTYTEQFTIDVTY